MNFKDLQTHDLKSAYSIGEFADTATYYPRVGNLYQLSGIFDEPEEAIDPGVGVVMTQPVFSVIVSDLQTEPSNYDEIEIRGKRYRVKDYEPDGIGCADIFLSLIKDYYGNK